MFVRRIVVQELHLNVVLYIDKADKEDDFEEHEQGKGDKPFKIEKGYDC